MVSQFFEGADKVFVDRRNRHSEAVGSRAVAQSLGVDFRYNLLLAWRQQGADSRGDLLAMLPGIEIVGRRFERQPAVDLLAGVE